ncbi:magnesium transporter [Candidatus Bathyarchaeota archaeon]|nr:magnesium transporter [Candidatus Bathyarchaeota archaeon]
MTETNIAETTPRVRGLITSLGQSILSLSFNFGGMLAGTLLAVYLGVFSLAPWTLALFPGILSVRGAIGGLFSGRLSTGLHLGTVKASYTKNTKDFYLLLRAVIVLSLVSGIMIGLGASMFGLFLWKTTVIDFIEILAVITATMGLSIVFVSPITIAVSALSFRRGLDPDVTVYPITSTVADIIVTACYIFSLNIFFTLAPFGYYLIGLLDFVFLLVVVYLLVKNVREENFVETIKEFLFTLVFVTFIVNVTGSFLVKVSEVIGNRPEIYVVYPALIDTVGDVGSIVGSTATTNLALGTVKPSFSSIKQHLTVLGGGWMASMTMFTLYFITASFMRRITTLDGLLKFAAQLLTTNILAVSAMVIIAYAVAIFTYRRGWDPDNFVIPIESSLADSITTISLLIALTVIV